jgi:sec-independent protein translocase protein TatA
MGIGWTEILVILLILVVLFGARKLPEIGRGMGESIRNFKKALREGEEDPKKNEKHDVSANK